MKTILALCLILCCCVSAEAGGFRGNRGRNNAQRQKDFNRGVAAGLRAANGGGHCNNGGRFNGVGGGNVNRQIGLINFGR